MLTSSVRSLGERPWLGVVVVTVIVGAVLRLTGLSVHSLWLDEGFSLYTSLAPDFVDAVRRDGHPPVNAVLLRNWPGIAGPDEFLVRLAPALASCASLILFAWITRCRLDPFAAAVATLFYALSPFLIWYAQELRCYALAELGSLIVVAGWARFDRGHLIRSWVLIAAGTALAFGSHYLAPLVCFGVIGAAMMSGRLDRQRLLSVVGMAVAMGVGGLVWLPWMLRNFPEQLAKPWGSLAHVSIRDLAEIPTRLVLVELSHLPVSIVVGIATFVALALLVTLHRAVFARDRQCAEAWALFLVPIAVALSLTLITQPRFVPRYLIGAAIGLNWTMGLAVARLPWRRTRIGIAALAAAALLFAALYLRTENLKDDYRGAARSALRTWRDGDVLQVITGMPMELGDTPVRFYLADHPAIIATIGADSPSAGGRIHALIRTNYTATAERALRTSYLVEEEFAFQNFRHLILTPRP